MKKSPPSINQKTAAEPKLPADSHDVGSLPEGRILRQQTPAEGEAAGGIPIVPGLRLQRRNYFQGPPRKAPRMQSRQELLDELWPRLHRRAQK